MANENQELEEDKELRKLMAEYEQLYKEKEETDEVLETSRHKNKEFEEYKSL